MTTPRKSTRKDEAAHRTGRNKTHSRARRLTAVYLPAEEGGYTAEVLEATAVYTQGDTIEQARENLAEVIQLMLEEAPQQFRKRRRRPPPGALTETFFLLMPA